MHRLRTMRTHMFVASARAQAFARWINLLSQRSGIHARCAHFINKRNQLHLLFVRWILFIRKFINVVTFWKYGILVILRILILDLLHASRQNMAAKSFFECLTFEAKLASSKKETKCGWSQCKFQRSVWLYAYIGLSTTLSHTSNLSN